MKISLALLAAAVIALPALSASELDFALVNQTGQPITALYLSASADQDWNENLLPEGAELPAGARAPVKFAATPSDVRWDIRAVDPNGAALTFEKVNLIDVKKITLQVKDGQTSAIVE